MSGTVPDDAAATPKTFAEKLNHLFEVVRAAGGEAYTPEYVSAWLRTHGGPTMSTTYLYLLRRGERDNPTKSHIEALARFFQIPPGYFFDDELTARIDEQLALVAAIRDNDVRDIAMRSAALHGDDRRALTEILGSIERWSSTTRRPQHNRPPTPTGDPASSAESDAESPPTPGSADNDDRE